MADARTDKINKFTSSLTGGAKAASSSLGKSAKNSKKTTTTTSAGGISPEAMDVAFKMAGMNGPLGAAVGATTSALSAATNGFQNLAGIAQADFTKAFHAAMGGGDLYTALKKSTVDDLKRRGK